MGEIDVVDNSSKTIKILEDFLLKQCKKIKNLGEIITNSNKNNKVAVIVEPRNHKLLEAVIRNVMYNLGKEWNLHIFGYDLNYIKSCFPKSNFTFTKISCNNLLVNQYNTLLTSLDFWNSISEENILIFQTDSFIMNNIPNLNKFLKYPFIGGVYHYYNFKNYLDIYDKVIGYTIWDVSNDQNIVHFHNSPYKKFSICGGFSLRLKSAMIKCIKEVCISDIIKYREKFNLNVDYYKTCIVSEDTYFQNALELLQYNLPSLEVCNEFCNNLQYPIFNQDAFGIHNINKEFLIKNYKDEIENFIQNTYEKSI